MKTTHCKKSSRLAPARATPGGPSSELAALRSRLAETEETLRAICTGEVDTVVVAGKHGPQVFTLKGAEHAYRVLIECMNEGALTLTAKGVILYANQCFARMVKRPLEQVLGSSIYILLAAADQAVLRPLLKRTARSGSKMQALLHAGDGARIPTHLSIRLLAGNESQSATLGIVVTDMTETRLIEEQLRALTHRVVQVQEAERGRVALELHANITQLLCAILVRCQTLVKGLSSSDGSSKGEAIKLREMLGQTAEEVERISRNLRPSVLDELGLGVVLRDTSTKFAERTGVSVKLACVKLTARLSSDIELTLYRILQEALRNVEKHARARHVTICLKHQGAFIQLVINDDGIGFDPDQHPARRKGKGCVGLLGMRERATYVGGTLIVKSTPHVGTEIIARIPMLPVTSKGKGTDL